MVTGKSKISIDIRTLGRNVPMWTPVLVKTAYKVICPHLRECLVDSKIRKISLSVHKYITKSTELHGAIGNIISKYLRWSYGWHSNSKSPNIPYYNHKSKVLDLDTQITDSGCFQKEKYIYISSMVFVSYNVSQPLFMPEIGTISCLPFANEQSTIPGMSSFNFS